MAKWDGTNWSALGVGLSGVATHAVIWGSNVVFGGRFTNAGGLTATNIAQWDGTNWSPLDRLALVGALAVNNTDLYAGGSRVRKWSGSNWTVVHPKNQPSTVGALLFSEGVLYVAGENIPADTGWSSVVKWDGTQWLALGQLAVWCDPGSCPPWRALAVIGTEVYVAGAGYYGPYFMKNFLCWDGASWSGQSVGVGYSDILAMQAHGNELYLGGSFSRTGDTVSTNIALWHIPPRLNINRSGNWLTLSWPSTGTNFLLEACSALGSANWTAVPEPVIVQDGQCVVTNELSDPRQFYRLQRR